MSTINTANTRASPSPTAHTFTIECACIDEKIQHLMHKIQATNEERHKVNRQLVKLDPASIGMPRSILSPFQYLKEKFNSLIYREKISTLLAQKATLEESRDVNHNALSYYEKKLKKCKQAFQVFKQENNLDFADVVEKELEEIDFDIKDRLFIDIRPYGVSLRQILPCGLGADAGLISSQKRANKLFGIAMSCSYIKDLYIEAMLTPDPITGELTPWSLWLLNDELSSAGVKEFGGVCSPQGRYIQIDQTLPDDEVLSIFVFELTNAVSSQKFHDLDQAAKEGKIDRETYAKEIERVEYEGTLRHHRIMSSTVKTMGWNPSMDTYQGMPRNFEIYWSSIKKSSHTELYRMDWDELQKKVTTSS